jgi:RNA polymerase sigma-70 factor (ECF subfamily)
VPAEDTRAFEELFARCERRLGRFLAQIVRDRQLAEDLLQDTFHDAFRDRFQLASVENEEAWLYGIARNRALNALRGSRLAITSCSRSSICSSGTCRTRSARF